MEDINVMGKDYFLELLDKNLIDKSTLSKDITTLYDLSISYIEELYNDPSYTRFIEFAELYKRRNLTDEEKDHIQNLIIKNSKFAYMLSEDFWKDINRTVKEEEIDKFILKTEAGERFYTINQTIGADIKICERLKTYWNHEFLSYIDAFKILESYSKYPIIFEGFDILGAEIYGTYYLHSHISLYEDEYTNNVIKVFIHELTHSMIHNPKLSRRRRYKKKDKHKYEKEEVEAEMVSYIVSSLLKMDSKEVCMNYIALQGKAYFSVPLYLRGEEERSKIINLVKEVMINLESNFKLYALYNIAILHLKEAIKDISERDTLVAMLHLIEIIADMFKIDDCSFTIFSKGCPATREYVENYLETNKELLYDIAKSVYLETKDLIKIV